jgi:hypothetical protein
MFFTGIIDVLSHVLILNDVSYGKCFITAEPV